MHSFRGLEAFHDCFGTLISETFLGLLWTYLAKTLVDLWPMLWQIVGAKMAEKELSDTHFKGRIQKPNMMMKRPPLFIKHFYIPKWN